MHTHIYMHISMHIHTHTCRPHAYIHAYPHASLTYAHTHACMHAHTHTHTHTDTHTQTHTHTQTDRHTHTHTPISFPLIPGWYMFQQPCLQRANIGLDLLHNAGFRYRLSIPAWSNHFWSTSVQFMLSTSHWIRLLDHITQFYFISIYTILHQIRPNLFRSDQFHLEHFRFDMFTHKSSITTMWHHKLEMILKLAWLTKALYLVLSDR